MSKQRATILGCGSFAVPRKMGGKERARGRGKGKVRPHTSRGPTAVSHPGTLGEIECQWGRTGVKQTQGTHARREKREKKGHADLASV